MKNFGYNLVKWWVKAGLHLYFGKIKISGLENVPKNKPVLFLPNHQNALLDVLLIGVDCNRKPYFLTRSDVFKGSFLNAVFKFFQMIPIYRIRDGRESLKNNQAVFDTCADLLKKNNAILMFPEANHNLKRRVRPLSKGFTRILFNAIERNPELDILIVPVGINYRNGTTFPDKVSLYFGKPIPVQESYDAIDIRSSVELVKENVSAALEKLTTHIADEESYDVIIAQLDKEGVDYLEPAAINERIASLSQNAEPVEIKNVSQNKKGLLKQPLKTLFLLLNLPIVLIWKTVIKPKVWEPEFMGTLRFGFALLAYPVYYLLIFAAVALLFTPVMALLVFLGLFFFNWFFTKLSR